MYRFRFNLNSKGYGAQLVTGQLKGVLKNHSERIIDVFKREKELMIHLFISSEEDFGSSLSLNENADPTVRSDMDGAVSRLSNSSQQCSRSLFGGGSLCIPISFDFNNRIDIIGGTWQGLYLMDYSPIDPSHSSSRSVQVLASVFPSSSRSSVNLNAFSQGCKDISSNVLGNLSPPPSGGAYFGNALILHTSASISFVNPSNDIVPLLNSVVPYRWNREFFVHTYEGEDDMPGHVKCSLVGPVATLPLPLSSRQDRLCLLEHRSRSHRRTVITDLIGPALFEETITISKEKGKQGLNQCDISTLLLCGDENSPTALVLTSVLHKILSDSPQSKTSLLFLFLEDDSFDPGFSVCKKDHAEEVLSCVSNLSAPFSLLLGQSLLIPFPEAIAEGMDAFLFFPKCPHSIRLRLLVLG